MFRYATCVFRYVTCVFRYVTCVSRQLRRHACLWAVHVPLDVRQQCACWRLFLMLSYAHAGVYVYVFAYVYACVDFSIHALCSYFVMLMLWFLIHDSELVCL